MTITIFLFLVGSVLAGFAITLLSGLRLTIEERIFFGAVLGLMAVTAATFGFFLAFGLGPLSLGLGFGFTVGLGTVSVLVGRSGLTTELREFTGRWTRHPLRGGYPWALWLLLLLSWTYTLHFFSHAYVLNDQGLTAGYITIWGDWGAHLSYAGSFAYGDNRPPEFFIDPGHRLGYAFAIDFLAAMMVHLGATLPNALVISSTVLALAFPGVMYCVGLRLVKSQAAAALAVVIFAMMGGIGFIYYLADIDKNGMTALTSPPHEYTLNRDLGYQWLDPVLAYLVPQRSVLFGFSLILITAALLWIAKNDPPGEGTGQRRKTIRPLLFAGVVVGLTPVFHPYAYGTAIALGGFWALLDGGETGVWWRAALRGLRSQLAFLIPALALGLPALLWLLSASSGNNVRFLPGWLAFTGVAAIPSSHLMGWLWDWLSGGIPGLTPVNVLAWFWFWIKNVSLFLPLLVVAQLWKGAVPERCRLRFLPLWLWFVVPNLFVFQPWEWDNTKFFVFWALFGSMLVAALVVRMAAAGVAGQALATACVVLLVLTGGIDLYRASNYSISSQNLQFTDAGGVRLAAWVRDHTDPQATFLVAHEHNNPVMALAGRRVVIAYPSWLWTYGISDYATKQSDVERMLRGDPQTPELVRRYHVDYVVIGPQERSDPYRGNVDYWRANATQVREDGEYLLFETGTKPEVRPVPAPTVHELGFAGAYGLTQRCISLGYKDADAATGTWMCGGKAGAPQIPLDMNAACEWAYGAAAKALQKDPNSSSSWVCVRHE